MASSPSPSHPKAITHTTDDNNVAIFDMKSPPTGGTTFVQADPSNFRALVQKLTGASRDSSNHKPPVTYRTRESVCPRVQPFKLQERRQNRKKLEISLQIVPQVQHLSSLSTNYVTSYSPVQNTSNTDEFWEFNDGCGGDLEMYKASPLSTLDFMVAHRTMINSRTQMGREEQEERGIAEKGYYLHPTPPGCRGSEPPELLPLFPLHHSHCTSCDP